ncbi:hypothetical protein [Primorskyibacter sp. 2E233]|uniref:hypothetical protein n=1 Tax=Primorskyibacter sp. 2E233 TaxID=3413431 RepID=UPI003BF0C390
MIDQNSRYAAATQDKLTTPDGSEQGFVVPPILPHPQDHSAAQTHYVSDSDRPDTIAARAYGQATAWWILANGNSAAHPDQLTQTVGAPLVIPSPGTGGT